MEAAGNGNNNMDDYLPGFVRYTPTDCQAIMVGAATPDGVTPLGFSNYGVRLDANGWGSYVATTGGREGDLYGGSLGDHDRYYTQIFGGTSSATPMVAGAVLSIQGMHLAKYGVPLSPVAMRDLITATGTPHQAGGRYVGPRPDIYRAWALVSDDFPPQAIDDLFASTPTSTHINLIWHAPIDRFLDGEIQAVAAYDIRFSTAPINDANFDQASPVAYTNPIFVPELPQGQLVDGLAPSTTYYFAVKSRDARENVSPLSNLATAQTLPPEPDLEISFSAYRNPVFAHDPVAVDILMKNRGSLPLSLNAFTVIYAGTTLFEPAPFQPSVVAPGNTFVLSALVTPTAPGLAVVLFSVASNDPQGLQSHSITIDALAVPAAAEAGACAGGTVESAISLANGYSETLDWRFAWASDSEYGPAGGPPGSPGAPTLSGTDFAIDVSHTAAPPANLNDLSNALISLGATVSSLSTISATTLAGVEALFVPGTDVAWTATERAAVAAWVEAGGSLYLDTAPSPLMQAQYGALLAGLGSGTTIEWDPGNPPGLSTTQLADHPAAWNVSEVFLGLDSWIGYDQIQLSVGAGDLALVRTSDGVDVKIAAGDVGRGRYVVLGAPILRDGIYNAAGNSMMSKNLAHWLVRRAPWVQPLAWSGSVSAGATGAIGMAFDTSLIPMGAHQAYYALELTAPTATRCLVPIHLNVHGLTLSIGNLAVQALALGEDCGKSRVTWTTSEAATCTISWGLYGGTLDQSGVTPLGLQHAIVLPTERAKRYSALVVAASPTCGVPVQSPTNWRTTKYCLQGDSPMAVAGLPVKTELLGAVPNPSHSRTSIRFALAAPQRVALNVFDIQGRRVAMVVDEMREAGTYQEMWSGRDGDGHPLASGLYYAVLRAGEYEKTTPIVLLK